MSKIKVYVRVRPPLPGEFDVPGTFDCCDLEAVSGNWIQIKKEGEQKRYFQRVWGPRSDQEEMFRCVGVNTVNDVFEGYYGCIFVYGQTGTGKTFTLGCLTPGLEGIQPQCLKFMYEKIAKEAHRYDVTIKQQYVQLYRDAVQDLLDISKDNLKIRVDEKTGAVIEKVTTREVYSYDDSVNLIKEGDSNRVTANTKMNSASSRSHACLITEVLRKDKTTGDVTSGRLYLIDLAGSERVSKSGVSEDAFKEAVAINKSLTTLGNCISGLVNNEKVVSFRESQLTRVLQHSLTGHGRTSIIVTIRPDSPNMSESLCTLKFGERAQKVEAQMTPASYQEQMLDNASKSFEIDKCCAQYYQTCVACKTLEAELRAEIKDREKSVKKQESETRSAIENQKKEHEGKLRDLETNFKREEREMNNKQESSIGKMKIANASVIKEIDDKVEKAISGERAKYNKAQSQLKSELADAKKEQKKLTAECDKIEADLDMGNDEDGDEVDYDEKAEKIMEGLRERVAAARRKLRGCKSNSRNDGMSVMQLREKESDMKEVLAKMIAKRSKLLRKAEDWDVDEMKDTFEKPALPQLEEFVKGVQEAADSDDDDSSMPPPSDEPPPTDSDMDSSDDDTSDDTSDDDSSDSDSSDDSSDVGSSDEESPKHEEEEEYDEECEEIGVDRVTLDMTMDGAGNRSGIIRRGRIRDVAERKQLENSLKRDQHLGELLEQICEYLEYGATCFVVTADASAKPPVPPKIKKCHLFLAKGRKLMCYCEYKDGTDNPDRAKTLDMIKLSDIGSVSLGQFSDVFSDALVGAPMVPRGTPMPATSQKITLKSLPIFFYRSMTVKNRAGKAVLSIVLNQDTDFEAWIVTMHRLTMRDPCWGGPLEIEHAKDVGRLSDEEKVFCRQSHILPSCFVTAKNNVLHKEPRLFYTLFDMRTVSNLDLLHSQKLFEFFFNQKYFQRTHVFQLRYLEIKQQEADEAKRKDNLRSTRLKIVGMLRIHKNYSTNAIQGFLRTIIGKEDATLQALVSEFGPVPTDEQLKQLEEEAKMKQRDEAKPEEEEDDEAAPPPPPPPRPSTP